MKAIFLGLICLMVSGLAHATGGVSCAANDKNVSVDMWGTTGRMPGSPIVGGMGGTITVKPNALYPEGLVIEMADMMYIQYFNYKTINILAHYESEKKTYETLTFSISTDGKLFETEEGIRQKGKYTLELSKGVSEDNLETVNLSLSGKGTCQNE